MNNVEHGADPKYLKVLIHDYPHLDLPNYPNLKRERYFDVERVANIVVMDAFA